MSRCSVDPVEDDGPGEIAGNSENLRVEEVPESDQQSGEGDDNDHPIEQPQIRLIGVASGVDEQRGQDADRGTVAGEPAFPHHQNLVRIAEVVSRVVEEAMTEARACDGADHHVNQERSEIGFRLPLSPEDGTDDVVSDEEREREEDAVVPDRERTDLEKVRVDTPDDCVRLRQRIAHGPPRWTTAVLQAPPAPPRGPDCGPRGRTADPGPAATAPTPCAKS